MRGAMPGTRGFPLLARWLLSAVPWTACPFLHRARARRARGSRRPRALRPMMRSGPCSSACWRLEPHRVEHPPSMARCHRISLRPMPLAAISRLLPTFRRRVGQVWPSESLPASPCRMRCRQSPTGHPWCRRIRMARKPLPSLHHRAHGRTPARRSPSRGRRPIPAPVSSRRMRHRGRTARRRAWQRGAAMPATGIQRRTVPEGWRQTQSLSCRGRRKPRHRRPACLRAPADTAAARHRPSPALRIRCRRPCRHLRRPKLRRLGSTRAPARPCSRPCRPRLWRRPMSLPARSWRGSCVMTPAAATG